MNATELRRLFPMAEACTTLADVMGLMKRSPAEKHPTLAALGMALSAFVAKPATAYMKDTQLVLTELSRAKAALDEIAPSENVNRVTAAIVDAANRYTVDNTIPVTEWPTPAELIEAVIKVAARYARA